MVFAAPKPPSLASSHALYSTDNKHYQYWLPMVRGGQGLVATIALRPTLMCTVVRLLRHNNYPDSKIVALAA